MSFTDKTLVCRDCGKDFTFTAGEQEFYQQKGFTNEPSRCPSCRQLNKQNRGKRDSFGGGRDSFGSRDRGQREMHSATCASCGKEALVPFVPRGGKPVYCKDCFQSQRETRNDRYSRW